jgi:hypothetical protein
LRSIQLLKSLFACQQIVSPSIGSCQYQKELTQARTVILHSFEIYPKLLGIKMYPVIFNRRAGS